MKYFANQPVSTNNTAVNVLSDLAFITIVSPVDSPLPVSSKV
ncbi:MAG: hypothetical protein VB860_06990 [Dehalococcoidia bacterium]